MNNYIENGFCLGVGCFVGFIFCSILNTYREKELLNIIDDYKRKNKKLIFFIRFKLNHITHDEYEREVKDIEI